MMSAESMHESVLQTWRTSSRITTFFVEHLSENLWAEKIPGYKRKTVQMICGHLHNTRCMWIKTVGKKYDVSVPDHVDRHHITQEELVEALEISSEQFVTLLKKALAEGMHLPGFSLDAIHLMHYLGSHEAHHRGQIIAAARQLGYELPEEVRHGIWQWSKRSKEIDQ